MSTVFHNILRAADKRYARRFAVLGAVFLAVLLGSLLVGRYALSPGQLVHMLWTRISGGAADWPISDDKVVFAVRLPRVAAAALVIGLLVRKPFMGLNHFMEEKLKETEML